MGRFDITIAGEINLDLILYGLPPELPVERELLAERFSLTLGSSSAILAHNLSVLGLKVGFATRIGADPLARIALDLIETPNLKLQYPLPSSQDQTGTTIQLHHGSTRHILTHLGVIAAMNIYDLDLSFLTDSRHFHLSSLFLQKGLHPDLPELFRELKRRGLTLSLDTNDDPDDRWGTPLDELLGLVDVLLPNEDEALRMTHTASLSAALDILAKRVPVIVVKCGRQGSVVQAGSTRFTVPSVEVEPVDTIGAGDSFNAGFLQAYLQKLPLEECAAAGNATAALSTLRSGGTEAFRDATLLKEFLQQQVSTRLVSRS